MRVVRHQAWISVALGALALLFWAGCDRAFAPKGTYERHLVVYSFLSKRSDSQYVRVYTTYDPPGYNPLEVSADTYVQGARVTMTDDSSSFTLAGAIIPRVDKSRYTTDIPAYLGFPFPVKLEKTYRLSVTSTEGSASATVTTLGIGSVDAVNPFVLQAPQKYSDDISARIRLSPEAQGYIVRLFIEFDSKVGQGVVHRRVEVPSTVVTNGVQSNTYHYPKLVRRNASSFIVYEYVSFSLDGYRAFLQDLGNQYGEINLTRGVFILTQVEPNLYKYFNLVNGFQDEFSIRTDQPDYSNIVGGFGVFGAMRDDSVAADLR